MAVEMFKLARPTEQSNSFSIAYCSDALFNRAHFLYCLLRRLHVCVVFNLSQLCVFYSSFVSELCDKCTIVRQLKIAVNRGQAVVAVWFCLVTLIE